MTTKEIKLIVTLVICFIAILFFNPLVMIRAGQQGVVMNFGAVSDKMLDEGLHFRMPFYQKVVKMDVTIQKNEASEAAASKDLQTVTTDVAINYHLDKTKVNTIYQTLKKDYKQRVVVPTIEEFIKQVTAKYTAEELLIKREEVKAELKSNISNSLAGNGIIVKDVFITNFTFSESFDSAIEKKVTAEQDALAAKNKLEQIKFEAEQRVTQAKAEAEAIKIQAEAITSQGGQSYVDLQAISKWSGILPQYMIPGGAIPFINLDYGK